MKKWGTARTVKPSTVIGGEHEPVRFHNLLIYIAKLDPNRTEFAPSIREATMSDHPVVRSFAREFFGEGEDPNR